VALPDFWFVGFSISGFGHLLKQVSFGFSDLDELAFLDFGFGFLDLDSFGFLRNWFMIWFFWISFFGGYWFNRYS